MDAKNLHLFEFTIERKDGKTTIWPFAMHEDLSLEAFVLELETVKAHAVAQFVNGKAINPAAIDEIGRRADAAKMLWFAQNPGKAIPGLFTEIIEQFDNETQRLGD